MLTEVRLEYEEKISELQSKNEEIAQELKQSHKEGMLPLMSFL